MGSTMYSDYFGIRENAFSITPDPRFLFMSERHCEALAHLRYGVTESGCFILLTGEVGTGKTTVCRALLEQLPANVDVALLLSPPRTWQELLLSIADELHVVISRRHASQHELVSILTHRLLENYGQGRRTVVIIDEAQNIPHDVLEQVRLLTNLETHTDKLLHVILVGQPELRELLKLPSLRQVAQRITARYHLDPLSNNETQAYVSHRLRVAGYQHGLFSKSALHTIYLESRGIPRVINILCDRAMLGAYANDKSQVTSKQIRQAACQWRGEPPRYHSRFRFRLAAALAVTGIIVVTILIFGYGDEWHKVASAESVGNFQAPAPSMQNPIEHTSRFQQPDVAPSTSTLDTSPAKNHSVTERTINGSQSLVASNGAGAILSSSDSEGRAKSTHSTSDETGASEPTEALRPIPEKETVSEKGATIKAQPIPAGIRAIGPGSPPRAVRWLRRELDRIDGTVSGENNPMFDDQLRERVMMLQRKNGLIADGIAGPVTLNYMHVIYGTSVPFQTNPSWTASRSRL